ncbi:MAG: MATE family efflux transporter [Christensenellales bacterium]|jgi:putative MATE family efflux protein
MHRHTNRRFILMTGAEFTSGVLFALLFSIFVGKISPSAMSTSSLGNQAIGTLTAVFNMLATGASILCARLIGEGDTREASRIVEQTTLLCAVTSTAAALLCVVFARPIMRLLMPCAEEAVFQEGLSYFRTIILSLPFLMLLTVMAGALRAAGDPKSPLLIALSTNVLLFLFAFLFLSAFDLGATGAGLCYLCARVCGTAIAFAVALRSHDKFVLSVKNMLRPHVPSFKRVLHVGFPTAVEGVFVQIGYLIANAMVMGLGTYEAAVYNISYTIYGFIALPQSICSACATTIIGQLIGAGEKQNAKKTGWRVWRIGMITSLLLGGAVAFCTPALGRLYTTDAAVIAGIATMAIPMVFQCIPGISLNTLDPQLRVGGDVKYVMAVTVVAVWTIRLPLTYLMCYKWGMGAGGVYWANTISLAVRAAFNMRRFAQGKYLSMRV